jgi:hypothetical protein
VIGSRSSESPAAARCCSIQRVAGGLCGALSDRAVKMESFRFTGKCCLSVSLNLPVDQAQRQGGRIDATPIAATDIGLDNHLLEEGSHEALFDNSLARH